MVFNRTIQRMAINMQSPTLHRTAHGAARLQALTATATEMFLDQGYESVSLDELIGRVGGSRRNIYQHFGCKKGLFIEVVTQLCEEVAHPLLELDIEGDEIGKALARFGTQVLRIVLQPRTLALHRLMVAEGQRFPELSQAAFTAGHDSARRILAAWIEKRRTELRDDLPPLAFAEQFLSLLVSGPQLRAIVGLDPLPLPPARMKRLVNEAVSTFLDGARARAKEL